MNKIAVVTLLAWCGAVQAQTGNQWNEPRLPAPTEAGGRIVEAGADALYYAPGGLSTGFFRHTPSTGAWDARAPLPQALTGPSGIIKYAALAHRPGTAFIYFAIGYYSWGVPPAYGFYEYNTASDSWRTLAPIPFTFPSLGILSMTATASKVYLHSSRPGWTDKGFYEYSPVAGAPGTWTAKADADNTNPPANSHYPWDWFSSLCYPGTGDHLFGPCSRTEAIWRYSISTNSWMVLPNSAAIAGFAQGDLGAGPVDAENPAGSLFAVTGAWLSGGSYPTPSAQFHRYNIATAEWTLLTKLPAMAALYPAGGSTRYRFAFPGGDRIFMLRGFGSDTWTYSISNNRFETERDLAPKHFDAACTMTAAGGDDFYVLQGYAGGMAGDEFYRYRRSENAWKAMAAFPPGAKPGASLAWDGGDGIYALEGGSAYVWAYSIALDAWHKLPETTPDVCGIASQIVHVGGGRLFVSPGYDRTTVYSSIEGMVWTPHAVLPNDEKFGLDSRLCFPASGDLLYLLVGGGTTFRSLSISSGAWSLLAPAPESVEWTVAGTGSALGHPGRGRQLFACFGNASTFWSYRPSDDTWLPRPALPGMTGSGASMAGDGTDLFVLPGGWSRVLWRYTPNLVPVVGALGQLRRDGVTPLDPAVATHEGRIILKGGIDDDNVHPVRLQIELQPAGQPFTGVPTAESSLVDTVSVTEIAIPFNGLTSLAEWHWQAQAVNELNIPSGWKAFGAGPASVDFKTRPDELPAFATPVAQVSPVTRTVIGTGGSLLLQEGGVFFEGIVDDSDGDLVRLEVEVQPLGTPFADAATSISPMTSAGGLATAFMPFEIGSFHWQHRLVDSIGIATPWTSFGGNDEEAIDFRLQFGGSDGHKGCSGSTVGGTSAAWLTLAPLLLAATRRLRGVMVLALAATASAQSAPHEWSDPIAIPVQSSAGGIVATDPDTLYVGSNGNGGNIYRYTISTNTWVRRAGPGGYTNNMFTYLPGSPGYIFTPWSRYDIAKDEWKGSGFSGLAPWPINAGQGMAIVAANGGIYAYGGRGDVGDGTATGISFWRYEPTGNSGWVQMPDYPNGVYIGSWTRLADLPFAVGSNARLVYPGSGGTIYGTRGGAGNLEFWAYSIAAGTWGRVAADLPQGSGPMCVAPDGPSDFFIYNAGFHRYRTKTGLWEAPLGGLPGPVGGGLACAAGIIYAPRGGSTTDLWRYSVSQRDFLFERRPAPVTFNAGSAIAGIGDGDVYALRGSGTSDFQRYSAAGNQWMPDAATPGPVFSGASMTPAGGSIYATASSGSTDFWKFTPGAGWASLVPSPAGGSSLAYGGGDLIFMAAGGSDVLQRYSISRNEWLPPSTGAPASSYYWTLAYPGNGDLIYAHVYVNGLSTPMWSYSQSHDEWNVRPDGKATFDPADPPERLGAAACGVDNVLYFMPLGGGPGHIWAYTAPNDTWTLLHEYPGTPDAGAGIAWSGPGGRLYAIQGGATSVLRSYWIPPNTAPDAPTGLAQAMTDDASSIAPGATILPTSVTLSATLVDPDADPIRLEVEAQPLNQAFVGTGYTSGLTSSGQRVSVTVDNLVRGTRYHWQARTFDADGKSSAWVSFGAMPENPAETDFRIRPNTAPSLTAIGQFLALDGSPLPAGQILLNSDPTLRFEATLSDPEGDGGGIEIEVVRTDEDYAAMPTVISVTVASGAKARAEVALDLGSYRWKVRSRDVIGAAGPWMSFGGNADGEADFVLDTLTPGTFQQPILPPGSKGNCLSSAGGAWGLAGFLLLIALGATSRP